MGHPQLPTPLAVDNTTAVGFANKTIKQKMSKAIDMRFYWMQDRQNQGQFIIYWSPGATNLADYHSKHHPPVHHKQMRPTILHSSHFVNCLSQCLMRGCANPLFIAPPIVRPKHPIRHSIAPPIVRPKYPNRYSV